MIWYVVEGEGTDGARAQWLSPGAGASRYGSLTRLRRRRRDQGAGLACPDRSDRQQCAPEMAAGAGRVGGHLGRPGDPARDDRVGRDRWRGAGELRHAAPDTRPRCSTPDRASPFTRATSSCWLVLDPGTSRGTEDRCYQVPAGGLWDHPNRSIAPRFSRRLLGGPAVRAPERPGDDPPGGPRGHARWTAMPGSTSAGAAGIAFGFDGPIHAAESLAKGRRVNGLVSVTPGAAS